MTHINYGHKFLFDYETLNDLALTNGFKNLVITNPENIKNENIKEFFRSKNSNYKLQTEIFIAHT